MSDKPSDTSMANDLAAAANDLAAALDALETATIAVAKLSETISPPKPPTVYPEARTIINVKGVSLETWITAKQGAGGRGETMGERVTRALNYLNSLEEGPRRLDETRLVVAMTLARRQGNLPGWTILAAPIKDAYLTQADEAIAAVLAVGPKP